MKRASGSLWAIFFLALLLPCIAGLGIFPAAAQNNPPVPTTTPAEKTTPATKPAEPAAPTAQDPAAAPAAQPDSSGSHPATATTPAVPAPGSQPSAAKPGDDAAAANGPKKEVVGTGSSLLPHDLSPYGMFMNADVVVKTVMIGLIIASLVTWTVFVAKSLELFAAKGRAKKALTQLAEAASLGEAVGQLSPPKAPVTRLAQAALAETDRSRGLSSEGVKDRAAALLARIEARAGRSATRGTALLATIGSTAPFVGLFGTVWGIMNSFIGISKTNTTNLAVVAPGIAEALLATACGLVAAIPAVVIYNIFARSISGYRSILNDASAEIMRLLSRDLDRETGRDGIVPMGRRAAE